MYLQGYYLLLHKLRVFFSEIFKIIFYLLGKELLSYNLGVNVYGLTALLLFGHFLPAGVGLLGFLMDIMKKVGY